MSGWVYIFCNAAVPNHVKVGFTERDPDLRAKELAATGLPGEYTVEFAVLVSNPRQVEAETHRSLGDKHYHKEWFQCSVQVARLAIEAAMQDEIGEPWTKQDDTNFGSPLVPGHALEPYFTHLAEPSKGGNNASARPMFTLGEDALSSSASTRPMSGLMEYLCKFCDHTSSVEASHTVRCLYCGRTEVLS